MAGEVFAAQQQGAGETQQELQVGENEEEGIILADDEEEEEEEEQYGAVTVEPTAIDEVCDCDFFNSSLPFAEAMGDLLLSLLSAFSALVVIFLLVALDFTV